MGDTMPDPIPPFSDAVNRLRNLLADLGYSNAELLWVARDDFYGARFGWYYLAPCIASSTEADVAAYYERGRQKGLVSVEALFYLPGTVGCSVWFPELVEEEVQGSRSGLRVSVPAPMPIAAQVTSRVQWWLHRTWSNYGSFQRRFPFAVKRERLLQMESNVPGNAGSV